jgi:RNA polymerase sigma-70 factor, ECF subfamily
MALQAGAAAPPPVPMAGIRADAFGELTAPYRGALLAHCYRMLGSIDDAEDAVQEALVRAWRSRATFTEVVSLRAWLYRIATNVCLDSIERSRRGWSAAGRPEVQPIPADLIDEPSAGPEARYDARESISLAFLTALQVLSPRQRGVLILRDVLGWRAAEAADLLGLTVPAANSALHRARRALQATYPSAERDHVAAADRDRRGSGRDIRGARAVRAPAPEPSRLRSLLDRYVRAWETADVAGLVSLLREDAVVSMPPGLTIVGTDAIGAFLASSVFAGRRIQLEPVEANGVAAFVIHSGATDAVALEPFAVLTLDIAARNGGEDLRVTRMGVFADPRLVARFR